MAALMGETRTQESAAHDHLMRPVRLFYQAYNDHDLALWDEALAENYVGRVNGKEIPGPDAGKRFAEGLIAAFPDIRYTVEETVIQGNRVVSRWSASATHTGDLFGMPPTGRAVTMLGVTIFRIQDGQVAELWSVWDQHGLLHQLRDE